MAQYVVANPRVSELLQQAVNAELTSRSLYWARSIFWRSVGLERLADYYKEQAGESHAEMSAERLTYLGQQPRVETKPTEPVSGSITDQLKEDLGVEQALSDLYAVAIEAAAYSLDYQTEDIWREVQRQTQEHCFWLRKQLSQIDQMGEEVYLQTWARS